MLFQRDDQQREKQEMFLKAYEELRQAGERITVENLMHLLQGGNDMDSFSIQGVAHLSS